MGLRAKWRAVAAVCVLAAAVSVIGCGSDNPTAPTTPTPTPNPYPHDGYWVGTTSESEQVILRVVGNAVVQFSTYVRVTSSCYIYQNLSSSAAAAPIQNGAFTMSLTNYYTTAVVTVTGTFSSAGSMSGTISAMTIKAGACSTTTDATQKAALTFTAMQ